MSDEMRSMKLRSRSIQREATTPATAPVHTEPTSSSRIRSKSSSPTHKDLEDKNEKKSQRRTRSASAATAKSISSSPVYKEKDLKNKNEQPSQPSTPTAAKSSPVDSAGRSKKIKITTEFENVDKDKAPMLDEEDEPNLQIPELPEEMKLEILKRFVQDSTMTEKKSASLVCKEWEGICRKNFKLNWPELCDETSEILKNTKFDFEEVVVINNLIDISFPSKVFKRGSQVQSLKILTPNVTPENMTALAKAFPNIETLRVDLTGHSDERSTRFLIEDLHLMTAFSLTLRRVVIHLGALQSVKADGIRDTLFPGHHRPLKGGTGLTILQTNRNFMSAFIF